MRQHGAAAVALEDAAEPRTERNGAGQRDRAADGVHDGGAGEVAERERLHDRQPAVRSPGPVADDRIDEAGDADAVEDVADEAAAADHGARRDRRARVGEGELEDPERQQRNAGGAVGVGEALQEEAVVPMKPLPGSNMKAKPQAQNVTPQMQVSTMPSTRMLTDSRDRAKPASSITKPTCMPNTRNAAMSVHAVLMALIVGRRARRRRRAPPVRGRCSSRTDDERETDHLAAHERQHAHAHGWIAKARPQPGEYRTTASHNRSPPRH